MAVLNAAAPHESGSHARAVPPPPIRVLIADDDPIARLGLTSILLAFDGVEVVGEAEDGEGAVAKMVELEPDILLLDLDMPNLPGLEAMRVIVGKLPYARIILVTSSTSSQQMFEAMQLGVRGLLFKGRLAKELIKAVRAVHAGGYWLGGEECKPIFPSDNVYR